MWARDQETNHWYGPWNGSWWSYLITWSHNPLDPSVHYGKCCLNLVSHLNLQQIFRIQTHVWQGWQKIEKIEEKLDNGHLLVYYLPVSKFTKEMEKKIYFGLMVDKKIIFIVFDTLFLIFWHHCHPIIDWNKFQATSYFSYSAMEPKCF